MMNGNEHSRGRGETQVSSRLNPQEELVGSFASKRFREWAVFPGLLLSALLYGIAFPNFNIAEAAYVFLIPGLFALAMASGWKRVVAAIFFSGWLVWFFLLIWLRHVTLVGTILLSAILALFWLAWWLAAWWHLRRWPKAAWGVRLVICVGLASFWVVLEYLRGWFLWGFPWLPLAASQWERPVMLQVLPYLGAGGLSALLVFFNLSLFFYIGRLIRPPENASRYFRRFTFEFYLAVFMVAGSVWFYSKQVGQVRDDSVELARVGWVQPYAEEKWDIDSMWKNLETLFEQTRLVALSRPDLILWPESATPWPVMGSDMMRELVEELVRETETPLLMGNMKWTENTWWNGIFVVDPETGLHPEFYAKRQLVPYGEFNPTPWMPFVSRFVPFDNDATPGTEAVVLRVPIRGGEDHLRVAPLVCYEDIFSSLVASFDRSEIDFAFVATNNVWYGEEAGAYQHAAHSVLRAAEFRLPVLRSGNGGWSGWIDEFGHIHTVLTNEKGSIYFRGGEAGMVSVFKPFSERETPFARHHRILPWIWLAMSPVGFIVYLFLRRLKS